MTWTTTTVSNESRIRSALKLHAFATAAFQHDQVYTSQDGRLAHLAIICSVACDELRGVTVSPIWQEQRNALADMHLRERLRRRNAPISFPGARVAQIGDPVIRRGGVIKRDVIQY